MPSIISSWAASTNARQHTLGKRSTLWWQSGDSQYEKLSVAQRDFTVMENGLGFIVNLTDYLDTRLFLEHCQTSIMVAKEARDKVVLKLFSYTYSFSVYCSAAGV